jgi:hypothetical protein
MLQQACTEAVRLHWPRRSFIPTPRGGFHYYELCLGFLLASGLAALAHWRYNAMHTRSLSRRQKGEAIQVRFSAEGTAHAAAVPVVRPQLWRHVCMRTAKGRRQSWA